MFSCRTAKKRLELIQQYDIKPIAHVRLLNGQERTSCTGDLLTRSYYCFSLGETKETFLCGIYAANHFLRLTNQKHLPLFDPLVTESPQVNKSNGGEQTDRKETETWHPVAKQLHEAINLLVICWGSGFGKPLQDINFYLDNNKNSEPSLRYIKSINTIISKDRKNRTLQQMINGLQNHNNIRPFQFDLLNNILSSHGITSYFFRTET